MSAHPAGGRPADADAVRPASRGWRVTAVDSCATALARAAEHARP